MIANGPPGGHGYSSGIATNPCVPFVSFISHSMLFVIQDPIAYLNVVGQHKDR